MLALTFAMLSANAAPKTYIVTIENMQFNPATLTVKRGERVQWINKDLFPHTVTAGTHAFDSRSIAANASWFYAPAKPGSYLYGCTFHPTMHGTLTVQ
ncbi:cupredoxin domain-containing protein [Burkholderia sp. WSM2230]|uniref:cupredoxin domain-containing protein n=1 Tax=Burkholderia sp. WSM2230 TaxID=944435 RepID=UPI00055368E9|nr:cupredoxin family copper-binding protein [Burkholderia sp. WSM2230]